jgi:hypothetical protein
MNHLNDVEKFILREFFQTFPTKTIFAPADLKGIASQYNFSYGDYKIFMQPNNKVAWGRYTIEPFLQYKDSLLETLAPAETDLEPIPAMTASISHIEDVPHQPRLHTNIPKKVQHSSAPDTALEIPDLDPGFVSWGFYKDIKAIIKSGEFFPVFISGLSGSGKTIFVQQACAELKRPMIRIQITSETDETDLFGSWILEDGNLRWQNGPLVTCAKQGGIALIDEIDRSSSRIASLLGILEGKPFLIKKTGEIVHPAPGFNIIATGNTRGRGSENGKYTFAIIVDDALLERFYINYYQEFPTEKVIEKILTTQMKRGMQQSIDEDSEKFIDYLKKWVSIIYRTFENDAIDDIISLRRAVQILKIYTMFKNPEKAIKLGVSRFDEIEQSAFFDLFSKVSDIPITAKNEDYDVEIESKNQ